VQIGTPESCRRSKGVNLVTNKQGRGEEGQAGDELEETAMTHSVFVIGAVVCELGTGPFNLSKQKQAVVFVFYCLVFLLPLNVYSSSSCWKPEASWPSNADLLTVKRIFCLKYVL